MHSRSSLCTPLRSAPAQLGRERKLKPTFNSAWLAPIALAWLAALLPNSSSAQDMETLRGLEARLLEKRLQEYTESDKRARTAETQYSSLRQRLSGVLGDSSITLRQLRDLEAETSLARERAYLRDREATALRREIYSHLERIEEIDNELATIGARISGTWSIDFGEDYGAGTATFRMNGNRANGTYRLANGASGQISGELIGRNVVLVRYGPGGGRQLEVRGRVAQDGQSMAGDWVTTELASGRNSLGNWSARRVQQ